MEVKENTEKFSFCDGVTRFLEATAATIISVLLTRFGYFFIPTGITFILILTKQWLVINYYLLWLWKWDISTPEEGGRRIPFVCNLFIWQWFKRYFPVDLISESKLDKNKNYLFCAYPYGTFPYGMVTVNSQYANNFKNAFEHHQPYLLTSKQFFYSPIYRDIILALGMCSDTEKSMKKILSKRSGGKVAIVMGGAPDEALYSQPGEYTIVLKDRKDFVQVAIELGVPIVPVFSFGEVDIFKQVTNPPGSLLRTIQNFIIKYLNIPAIITLHIVPKRKAVNIVVGNPIEVQKCEDPTPDEVDDLHQKFTDSLIKLFENNKCKYLENSEDVKLTIL